MSTKGKKILILGNGFDLAHGLPTRYTDFLKFCRRLEIIYTFRIDGDCVEKYEESLSEWKINQEIKDILLEEFKRRKPIDRDLDDKRKDIAISENIYIEEIHNCLNQNVWYGYFESLVKENIIKGINWIDFESEISYIIQIIDKKTHSLLMSCDELFNAFREEKKITDKRVACFRKKLKFENYNDKKGYNKCEGYQNTVRDLREKCFEDLEKLTRALEIYCSYFVEKIPVKEKISEIEAIKPDYVINFNYTDTYERVYGLKNIFHIHGKCDCNRSMDENDMVLGIAEYWSKEERDTHINFTIFKKFAQRIRKRTGIENCKYMNEIQTIYKKDGSHWTGSVDTSTTHTDGTSFVYIFGHSLDVTDKDVLEGFFKDEATSVVVYCRDKGAQGELIANAIQIMTQELLLKKVNQAPPKLDFVIQKKDKL